MAKTLMFLGTGSDVGKSVAVTAFCRILKRRGFRVVPFKAQNMSNNSYVTVEGGEIGRAQATQAEAAGVLPSVHMNPVLLKPSSEGASQVIVHGEVVGQMGAAAYYNERRWLKRAVMESFRLLEKDYEVIVMEGAGSCCEMNLKGKDLVNLPMAKAVKAPCILVADIDRGGVFAQIIGTYHLMSPRERTLVMGFLINKFRGDPGLFQSGIDYIQARTQKPVFGLIPFYQDIAIDSEDSVAVQEDRRHLTPVSPETVNIAVLRLPSISNFTDLQALSGERDVVVNYLFRPEEFIHEYDCLILPGTKNVMEDARWIARTGWKQAIRGFVDKGGSVLGICGGYQLLGKSIHDPFGMEAAYKTVRGLGLLPVETTLEKRKIVRKVIGRSLIHGKPIRGYEIHMGITQLLQRHGRPFVRIREPGTRKSWEDGWAMENGQVSGTYVHGLLDAPGLRSAFLNSIRKDKGLGLRTSSRKGKSRHYDQLADHFEQHCDVARILAILEVNGHGPEADRPTREPLNPEP